MVYTIAKRSAKRLKFLNPDPFTKRESAVSNLWGYKKPQHYRPKRARFWSRAFQTPGTAHVSILFFGRIYQMEDFVSLAIF